MLKYQRFFIATSVAAAAIALAAAVINLFVGPLNAAVWIMPVFILGFTAITFVLVQARAAQVERPPRINWMVSRILGKRAKRIAYSLRWFDRWNVRLVSPMFVCFVPLVFLIVSVLMLILSIRGEITPGR
jgi:hypothetical protein